MVLALLGVEKSEAELRSICECDETGTSSSKVVKAAVEYGFDAYEANLIFEDLEDLVLQDITPIVYLQITKNLKYFHSVVIYKISNGKVFALDPIEGEREFDLNSFIEVWSRGLTIIIEKKQ